MGWQNLVEALETYHKEPLKQKFRIIDPRTDDSLEAAIISGSKGKKRRICKWAHINDKILAQYSSSDQKNIHINMILKI